MLGERIKREIGCTIFRFEGEFVLWQAIPRVDHVAACNLVAEIRVNMAQFPFAKQLAPWARLCPSNHKSTGKRVTGTTRGSNKWLRRTLCQAASAVTRKKNCHLSAQSRQLAGRKTTKMRRDGRCHIVRRPKVGRRTALCAAVFFRPHVRFAHVYLPAAPLVMLKTGWAYYLPDGNYLE